MRVALYAITLLGVLLGNSALARVGAGDVYGPDDGEGPSDPWFGVLGLLLVIVVFIVIALATGGRNKR